MRKYFSKSTMLIALFAGVLNALIQWYIADYTWTQLHFLAYVALYWVGWMLTDVPIVWWSNRRQKRRESKREAANVLRSMMFDIMRKHPMCFRGKWSASSVGNIDYSKTKYLEIDFAVADDSPAADGIPNDVLSHTLGMKLNDKWNDVDEVFMKRIYDFFKGKFTPEEIDNFRHNCRGESLATDTGIV